MGRKADLLQQIEDEALDSKASLADALRKCVALGGRAGSAELRDWATRELSGYEGDVSEVPEYRRIVAPLTIDGIAGHYHVKGQQISAVDLPDVAQEHGISEQLPLTHGVGALEEMVRSARAAGDPIRLSPPGGALLAKLMTAEMRDAFRHVERIYWNVSPTTVAGVLDQIRTRLVALVAEIRATTVDASAPSSDAISNAVEVVVHGKARNITVNAAQGTNPRAELSSTGDESRPWWRRTTAFWSFVVGAATIAAAVIAWIQLK